MADLIATQEFREDGIWTVFESGRAELRDYKVNENGEEYTDVFPNDEIIAESN
jgi:hypothetical protein